MKVTKTLRDLGIPELEARAVELKKELLKLRVQTSTGAAGTKSGKVREVRKNIARVLTILGQKGVGKEDNKH